MRSRDDELRALVRGEASPSSIDPELSALVAYHRLAPLVVRRHGSAAPPDLVATAREAAAVDLSSYAALREVFDCARAENVDFIVLKGTAVGATVYESPDLRPREDIDLVFSGWNAVHRVVARMTERGWSRVRRLPGRLVAHADVVTRTGRPSIDLHARASQRHRVAGALPWENLRAEAEPASFPGAGDALVLSPRHAFFLGAVHVAAHHGGQIAPLVWVEDLARLATSLDDEDWTMLAELAERHQLRTAFVDALDAVRWWAPGAVPARLDALSSAPPDASAAFVGEPALAFLDDLLVLPVDEWWPYLRELALPPSEYLHQQLGVARKRPTAILRLARLVDR